MAKITTGKQFDDSESKTNIATSPKSNLEVELGDQHDRSKRELNVHESPAAAAAVAPVIPRNAQVTPGDGDSGATALWAKGSFFLLAFITAGAVIGILAYKLPWYLVPVSVVGSIILLYLLAIVLVPKGPLTEKGLLSVLQAYVRLAFAVSPNANEKNNKAPARKTGNGV